MGKGDTVRAADTASIQHPAARRTTAVMMGIAGIVAFEAVVMGAASGPLIGVPMALFAGGLAVFTLRLRKNFRAVAVHNRATDLILRGDLDAAEPMLDAFATMTGSVGQSIALQRATVALLRGDMAAAEARATTSIQQRPRFDLSMNGGALCELARSVRAFARAAQGNRAGAEEDIRAVRAECKQTVPLARVAVAELLLSSRENKLEELRKALTENERVLEYAAPRERALVRSFERLVAAGGGALYRKPQSRTTDTDDATTWLSSVAPAVRGFVSSEVRATGEELALPVPAQEAAAKGKGAAAPMLRRPGKRPFLRVAALWAVLVVLFLAIWSLLQPSATGHAPPVVHHEASEPLGLAGMLPIFAVVFVLVMGFFAMRVRSIRARARALVDQESRAQLGDAAAIHEMEVTTRGRLPALAASAFAALSRVKLARGAFREVLADAEAGLNLVDTSAALRNAYSDILVPGLHAQRGLALAGMGRAQEAEAACAALTAAFPGYAYLSATVFRIRLLAAAREGEFEKAHALAKTRSADLPITAKEELLCAMLALAVEPESDEEELRRVLSVLKRNEEARTFVKLAAPGLAEAVGHLPSDHGKPRVAEAFHEEEPPSSDLEESARGSSPVSEA